MATSYSCEILPNSDHTVGPVIVPNRKIASPALLLVVSAAADMFDALPFSSPSGEDSHTPSKQGALSTVSKSSLSSVVNPKSSDIPVLLFNCKLLYCNPTFVIEEEGNANASTDGDSGSRPMASSTDEAKHCGMFSFCIAVKSGVEDYGGVVVQ